MKTLDSPPFLEPVSCLMNCCTMVRWFDYNPYAYIDEV